MLSSALVRSTPVNLRAVARVIYQDVLALEPVVRLHQRFGASLRWRSTDGIVLRVDREGRIEARLAVTVRRGTDLREAAADVQSLVRETLDRICDAPVGGIHVLIVGRR